MKTIIKNIEINKLRQHTYHQEVYESNSIDTLEVSFQRTGKKPVYPIVVIPHPEPDMYWVISGMTRLETLIKMEKPEVEVILYEITDETEIKNLNYRVTELKKDTNEGISRLNTDMKLGFAELKDSIERNGR